MCPISQYKKAIILQSQQCQTHFITLYVYKQGIVCEMPLQSFWFTLNSLHVYHKSSPMHGCEESIGVQSGSKVAPWCKDSSYCGWWKGTSQDKVLLISEEIKSVALAVLELCLSEGISK